MRGTGILKSPPRKPRKKKTKIIVDWNGITQMPEEQLSLIKTIVRSIQKLLFLNPRND